MPEPLSSFLYRRYRSHYAGQGLLCIHSQVLMPPNGLWDMAMLTQPRPLCTIHLYDINDAEDSFVLELRNLPRTVEIERLVETLRGETEQGQTHWTARLRCTVSQFPLLSRLAWAVREAPKEDLAGRRNRQSTVSFPASQAIRNLASALERFITSKSLAEYSHSIDLDICDLPGARCTKGSCRPTVRPRQTSGAA